MVTHELVHVFKYDDGVFETGTYNVVVVRDSDTKHAISIDLYFESYEDYIGWSHVMLSEYGASIGQLKSFSKVYNDKFGVGRPFLTLEVSVPIEIIEYVLSLSYTLT